MSISEITSQLISDIPGSLLPETLNIIFYIGPIVMAVLLGGIAWTLWIRYIQGDFYLSLDYAVLELRLPKETLKSPKAMETVLVAIHNTGDGGWSAKYWKGEYRPYYSLELVSIEGQVKFFIWTEDRRKGGVISALYSQFPGIEVYEREDYTKGIVYDPKEMKLWAANYKLDKPDAYPIKTYVDYGLDKDPKEEFKVDPITQVIEFLGSVPINQQIWIQILIRAHKKEQRKPGHLFKKYDAWEEEAREIINKEILLRDPKTKVAGKVDEVKGFTISPKNTKGEEEVVEAIERSLTKFPFDVGIRAIYFAPRSEFNTPFGIGGLISSFKQFSSNHLNTIKPDNDTLIAQFSGDPWEDYKEFRRTYLSKKALLAYKRRSYFFPPHKGKSMVLNAEELATIYHFPGSVAATPSLERVPSKKAEAPPNLPI